MINLSALLSLHDQATRFLDESSTFGILIISYDYSKAFDKLRFHLIIQRLISCGFSSKVIRWMCDYLKNRSQSACSGEVESDVLEVTSGVPQGSILGPFLYSFATATFSPFGNLCHVSKYADDTSLVFPLFKASDNKHVVEEHQHLLQWSAKNGLKMNFKKMQCIDYSKAKCLPLSHSTFASWHSSCGYNPYSRNITQQQTYLDKSCWLYYKEVFSVALCISNYLRNSSSYEAQAFILCYSSLCDWVLCSFIYWHFFFWFTPLGLFAKPFSQADLLRWLQRHRCLPTLSERRQQLTSNFLESILKDDHILHYILPPLSKSGRFLLPPRKTNRRSKSFVLFACEMYNLSFKR